MHLAGEQKQPATLRRATRVIAGTLDGESERLFFKRFYLFIFREKGMEGVREGEKHHCVVASCVSSTGDLACNPGMCPDWVSNRRPFGSQPKVNPLSYSIQQPGQNIYFYS